MINHLRYSVIEDWYILYRLCSIVPSSPKSTFELIEDAKADFQLKERSRRVLATEQLAKLHCHTNCTATLLSQVMQFTTRTIAPRSPGMRKRRGKSRKRPRSNKTAPNKSCATKYLRKEHQNGNRRYACAV